MNIAELFIDASHVGRPDAAHQFSEPFDGDFPNWWSECPCGSWMLWVAGLTGTPPVKLVDAACGCARQALQFLPADETRPESVIAVAEKWVAGHATTDECRIAGDSIGTVSRELGERLQSDLLPPIPGVNAAAAMLAAGAAEMAAMAVAYADDPNWCANFASQAATRAAGAARYAGDDESWWAMQETCAQLIRRTLPDFTDLEQ